MVSIKWLVNIPIIQSVNKYTIIDRSVYELTAKYANPSDIRSAYLAYQGKGGQDMQWKPGLRQVVGLVAHRAPQVNQLFSKEGRFPLGGNIKNLDIGATLDGSFLVKSNTPLSTFVFKEEEWLNWFGRSPWLTSFSRRGSNIENAFLHVASWFSFLAIKHDFNNLTQRYF